MTYRGLMTAAALLPLALNQIAMSWLMSSSRPQVKFLHLHIGDRFAEVADIPPFLKKSPELCPGGLLGSGSELLNHVRPRY
jgi:hypothetical protein